MKKLVAAVLTGALIAGTLGTMVFAEENTVIKIAASATPHAEILEQAAPILEEQGYTLDVTIFDDYVQPNEVVESGDFDANYFQHIPYLEKFAKDRNLKLVVLAKVHIEPMGVYSRKIKDLKDVKDGAKVGIPNDPTNGGRALVLLEKAGLLKLKEGKDITATKQDIVSNPKHLNIVEAEAAMLPRSLDDCDIAVINSNFAMEAKLNPVKDSLFIEKDSPYANVVAIREGDDKRPELQKLAKALTTPEVKKFIEDKYKGAVVPAF
jgi:D-methionine transport system substrate-binding protein